MKKNIDSKTRASVLAQYLEEIGKTPLLSREEEQILAARIQGNNDARAKKKMLKANLRLVVNVAKKYVPGSDPEMLMDLIQEGNLGLMKAVERFRPGQGTRFSTYGVYWIKQAVFRALKNRRVVRLPENVTDRLLAMQKTKQRLYQMLGRVPEAQEIAAEMDVDVEDVNFLEEAAYDVVSLDQAVRGADNSEETMLRDLLEDVSAPDPSEMVETGAMKARVDHAVDTLPDREKRILKMRFGMNGYNPHTLEEIGHEFGISRERVRQLQNSAFSRLRERRQVKSVV